MGLAEDNRKDIVIYRIERAFTALEQAKGNLAMNYLEITANRLYYAAYYAVSALLIAHEIRVHSHEGCIRQFNLYFVKTGIVPLEMGKLFSRLFDMRLTLSHKLLTAVSTRYEHVLLKNFRPFFLFPLRFPQLFS